MHPEQKPMSRIAAATAALEGIDDLGVFGRVAAVRGLLIEIAGPVAAMHLGGRLDIKIDQGVVPCGHDDDARPREHRDARHGMCRYRR